MLTGSAGQDIPDEHFVKSLKVFDPTRVEQKSLFDYEAERDTVEYVRIGGSTETKDIIHEKAAAEAVSTDSLMTSLNGYLREMKQKHKYLSLTVDDHIEKAKKFYSNLPK